eukprot:CAMPEP_0196577618 /NCGR_PEP_ID=MMETSP1081-20130531/6654_1 /TAXON_ID=36882 /ORGANISM="Pyramimonas amylifera, Strain CCMP720" /LENGTH=205 /DNA_ID=CAMNT_0041896589 /DNA_START=126 /DNA_END=740 /DNA_ORIENTATION=+
MPKLSSVLKPSIVYQNTDLQCDQSEDIRQLLQPENLFGSELNFISTGVKNSQQQQNTLTRSSNQSNIVTKERKVVPPRPVVRFPPPNPVPDPPSSYNSAKSEHKVYRQADGSMKPFKPLPSPYTVASRRAWVDLVHYARVTGGDKESTEESRSYRYGVNVTFTDHKAYLEKIGMEPETRADGTWKGFDAAKINPLDDPEHPLHKW